jgi:hypothetical protein
LEDVSERADRDPDECRLDQAKSTEAIIVLKMIF